MKCLPTKLPGLIVIEPDVFQDARGFFLETYNSKLFGEHGVPEAMVQDNTSFSRDGTLRGLHYQLEPFAQGKHVSCIQGEIFDVAVDIRRGSPTFGQWFGITLSATNKRAVYIPAGFAHGFCAITDATIVYKCTNYYSPQHARDIAWNDPAINISWPIIPNPELISEKDKKAPLLKDVELGFHFLDTPSIQQTPFSL